MATIFDEKLNMFKDPNSEAGLVFATLIEFVNAWSSGRDAMFHCEVKNQTATLRFETALGSPWAEPKKEEKKKKSLAKTKRDIERSKKHHEKLGEVNDAHDQKVEKMSESLADWSGKVDGLVGNLKDLTDQVKQMDSLIKSKEYLKQPSERSIEGESANVSLKSIDVGFSNGSERLKRHLKMIDESIVAAREKRKRGINCSSGSDSSSTVVKRAKCSDLHSTAVLDCSSSELPGDKEADEGLSLSPTRDKNKINPDV